MYEGHSFPDLVALYGYLWFSFILIGLGRDMLVGSTDGIVLIT